MTNKNDPADPYQPRRRLLRALAAGGGAFATGKMLPSEWTRPVVNNVLLPAHAQMSPSNVPTGNFGAAAAAGGLGAVERRPSVLDLFIEPAQALVGFPAEVGNVLFEAFFTVRQNDADICGQAMFLNTAVLLKGNVNRSGNSLDDFSQNVGKAQLQFTNQVVSDSGVSLTASANKDSGSFFAPDGPGCEAAVKGTSSPYPDDEEIV